MPKGIAWTEKVGCFCLLSYFSIFQQGMRGCIRSLLFLFVIVYKWYLTCFFGIAAIENHIAVNSQRANSFLSHFYGFTPDSEGKPEINELYGKSNKSVTINSAPTQYSRSFSRRTCTVGSLI